MGRPRSDRDYYAVLGVSPEATEDEIRKAYRRLALRWHPDRNPGRSEAAERFKEISEAYAVLTSRRRRAEYDTARRAGSGAGFHASREELFRDLFADPRRRQRLLRERAISVVVERRLHRHPQHARVAVPPQINVIGSMIFLAAIALMFANIVIQRRRGEAPLAVVPEAPAPAMSRA